MDQWLVNPADQYWSNRDIGSAGQSGVKSYTLCSQLHHLMQAMVMPNLEEGDHHVIMHCLSEHIVMLQALINPNATHCAELMITSHSEIMHIEYWQHLHWLKLCVSMCTCRLSKLRTGIAMCKKICAVQAVVQCAVRDIRLVG